MVTENNSDSEEFEAFHKEAKYDNSDTQEFEAFPGEGEFTDSELDDDSFHKIIDDAFGMDDDAFNRILEDAHYRHFYDELRSGNSYAGESQRSSEHRSRVYVDKDFILEGLDELSKDASLYDKFKYLDRMKVFESTLDKSEHDLLFFDLERDVLRNYFQNPVVVDAIVYDVSVSTSVDVLVKSFPRNGLDLINLVPGSKAIYPEEKMHISNTKDSKDSVLACGCSLYMGSLVGYTTFMLSYGLSTIVMTTLAATGLSMGLSYVSSFGSNDLNRVDIKKEKKLYLQQAEYLEQKINRHKYDRLF